MKSLLMFLNGVIFEFLFFFVSLNYKIQSYLEKDEYADGYNINYEMFGLSLKKAEKFGYIRSSLNND